MNSIAEKVFHAARALGLAGVILGSSIPAQAAEITREGIPYTGYDGIAGPMKLYQWWEIQVQPGDTLNSISAQFRTMRIMDYEPYGVRDITVERLQRWNPTRIHGDTIYAGQTLYYKQTKCTFGYPAGCL